MNYTERLANNAVVPTVAIEDVKSAAPTAKALLAGGIDVMEITLRTDAGLASIEEVAKKCPDILVGAGSVINLEQAKASIAAGAKFIVSPGFDEEIVKYCLENDVTVTPGCVTPTEVMAAVKLGVNVINFFPANAHGGLTAMRALAEQFGNITFIPTGGVNAENIGEYTAEPYIHTVSGSWICTKEDIIAENYDKITMLCKEAVMNSLGFEMVHVGINTENEEKATKAAEAFSDMFLFSIRNGSNFIFSGPHIEMMKSTTPGVLGHVAIRTNNIHRAVAFLEKRGYAMDPSKQKEVRGKTVPIYLEAKVEGFGIQLMQK